MEPGASSIFEVQNGVFSGRTTSVLATRRQKLVALKRILEGQQCLLAFGDSDSDIEMLEAARSPICVDKIDGDEAFRNYALSRGWKVVKPEDAYSVAVELLSSPPSV